MSSTDSDEGVGGVGCEQREREIEPYAPLQTCCLKDEVILARVVQLGWTCILNVKKFLFSFI